MNVREARAACRRNLTRQGIDEPARAHAAIPSSAPAQNRSSSRRRRASPWSSRFETASFLFCSVRSRTASKAATVSSRVHADVGLELGDALEERGFRVGQFFDDERFRYAAHAVAPSSRELQTSSPAAFPERRRARAVLGADFFRALDQLVEIAAVDQIRRVLGNRTNGRAPFAMRRYRERSGMPVIDVPCGIVTRR